MSQKIGNWLGCLLLDHRNPQIDVFACDVDGISSNRGSPTELMCSEEMRFLGEKEKDKVYLTRKILCAKFLAIILEALYESDGEIQGQRMFVFKTFKKKLCDFFGENCFLKILKKNFKGEFYVKK